MTKVRLTQGSAVGLLLISHVTSDDFQSKYQESNDGLVDCSADSVNQRLKSTFASSFCIWWSNCSWGWLKLYQLPKNRHDSIIWYDMILFNTSLIYIRLPSGCNQCWGTLLHNQTTSIRYICKESITTALRAVEPVPIICCACSTCTKFPGPNQPSRAVVGKCRPGARPGPKQCAKVTAMQMGTTFFWIFAGCQWVSSRIHAGWFRAGE